MRWIARLSLGICALVVVNARAEEPAPVPPAAPAPATASASASPLADDATPEQILDALRAKWKSIKDYACSIETTVKRGDKVERSVLEYQFKKPGLFRSKVIDGNDKGGVVARGTEGKIRAHAGGVLGLVTVTMAEDDARLVDARGARIQDADWGSQLNLFARRIRAGWTCRRLPDETKGDVACYVLESEGKPTALGETRSTFWIGKGDLTPRASRIWEGETLADDTAYSGAQLDRGLADDFFKM